MLEQIKEIALRLKGLRVIEELTEEQMAGKFSLPLSEYLEYESGQRDIPVSFLYEVANVFNMTLTEILTGESPKLHTFQVVRAGKGLNVERRKEYRYENLAFNFTHKKAEPFMVTVPCTPEGGTVSLNSHPGQEFDYMMSGSMIILIDGHEVILNEGDSIFYDSSYKHGMKALGNTPARFLAIIM